MNPPAAAKGEPDARAPDGSLPVRLQELLLPLLSRSAARAHHAAARASGSDLAELLTLVPARLLPYLAFRLRHAAEQALPAAIQERVAEIERLASIAFLRQQTDTRRVLQALEADSVPVLFLKGAALASRVYPQAHLRPTSDLDLWVDRVHMPAARRALERIGLPHASDVFGSQVDANALLLIQAPPHIAIEIHSPPESLAQLPRARLERMWQRQVQVQCGSFTVSALHPEDLLLHLILHLAKSGFADGIRPLLDIALVVDHWAELWDWQRLASEWQHDRVAVAATFTLGLVHRCLQAPVPAWLLQTADTGQARAMETLAIRQIWYGHTARVAAGLGNAVVPVPWTQIARKMVWRSTAYYWSSRESGRRPARQVVHEAKSRLLYDLRSRIPLLARAVVRGELSPGAMRWRRSLWHDRLQLLEFLAGS